MSAPAKRSRRVRPAPADHPAGDSPAPPRATLPRERKVPVTERVLQHAAGRLITTPLVSVEIQYLQRTLGNSETEAAIDEAITAVRRLPWTTIALGS